MSCYGYIYDDGLIDIFMSFEKIDWPIVLDASIKKKLIPDAMRLKYGKCSAGDDVFDKFSYRYLFFP